MPDDLYKPVWRVNTGNGIPKDLGCKIVFGDGFIDEVDNLDRVDDLIWGVIDDPKFVYAAYQTTRTRKAKYTRKECQVCKGKGKRDLKDWVTKAPFTGVCIYCNGKGYKLEAIQKQQRKLKNDYKKC